ncbi:Ubiquitin domain-containing protein 2, partial [Fasciola gigantica]
VSVGKNKPLRPVSVRWCSQFPLTSSQLQRKRDEFWETAPAFDGRVEIWNALKVAVEFLERNDIEMAQAIVDGADIILPTGTLCDCYDHLGARYQLPLYVLCEPSNLMSDESSTDNPASISAPENSETIRSTHDGAITADSSNLARNRPVATVVTVPRSDYGRVRCWPFSACCCIRRFAHNTGGSSNRSLPLFWSAMSDRSPTKGDNGTSTSHPIKPASITLDIRLSTGQNHQLELPSDRITVLEAKRLLSSRTNWPETRQRWFVCGHLLPNRARICDCQIPQHFIVQCIVHTPFEPESQWSKLFTVPSPSDSNPTTVTPSPGSHPAAIVESDPLSVSLGSQTNRSVDDPSRPPN